MMHSITIIFYYLCYVINMKVGAGTTAIPQACDRAQTFKATKKGEGSIEDMQNRNCIQVPPRLTER